MLRRAGAHGWRAGAPVRRHLNGVVIGGGRVYLFDGLTEQAQLVGGELLAGTAKAFGQRQVQLLAQGFDLLRVVFAQLPVFCLLLVLPPHEGVVLCLKLMILFLLAQYVGLQGLDVIGKIGGVQHAAYYTPTDR